MERGDPVCEEVGCVRVVAAEELVAAFPRERHLDVLRGQLGDEVRGQCGRVGEGLVERVRESGQQQGRVGPEKQLVMIGSVELGDAPCVPTLVEAALGEADRERMHGLRRLLRGQRRERRGVDAAGEEHADGHVCEQVRAHRVAQARTQLLEQLGLVVGPDLVHRNGTRPRVARELHVPVHFEHVAGRKLPHVAEDRVRRRNRVEGEERLEGVEVDLPARQRTELGRERELSGVMSVVERLDPVTVAREHEPAHAGVPDGDGEHAAQAPGDSGRCYS